MKAKEAKRFYEDDEKPRDVFAAFDVGQKELTAPYAEQLDRGPVRRMRHELAVALRRLANVIEPPQARA
jgi:hypothetical protein